VNPKSEQTRWFSEEVQPHEPSLRAHLRYVFPSLPDLDDIVQESYSRLIRAREVGRITYVKAFLFTTARNAALDIFRRTRISPEETVPEPVRLAIPDDRPGVEETVSRQQELVFLADAIRELPERCRKVLTLRKLYGVSQREIAQQLGISEHTVEVQVAKGMRRVRLYLARRGLP
jgi:RNA polymerase sigma-70 factor (ECF subfamily)